MNMSTIEAAVKERGISMSAPMIRAYMEGRKGQTRRLGKHQMDTATELGVEYQMHATKGEIAVATYRAYPDGGSARHGLCECPYGAAGSELYFKEAWKVNGAYDYLPPSKLTAHSGPITYLADGSGEEMGRYRHARFMPRWMSRFRHIPILGIRVERLGDINEQDAVDEGVERVTSIGPCRAMGWKDYSGGPGFFSAVESYKSLWTSINGSWDGSLWVWVIEFPKYQPHNQTNT
jgi:hypothetical protein